MKTKKISANTKALINNPILRTVGLLIILLTEKMIAKIIIPLLDSKNYGPALKVVALMLVVTGIAYPLILVAIGQSVLPFQSNGSLLTSNGKVIGSSLIAQEFKSQKFFHPRPVSDSASGLDPHITPNDAFSQIQNISRASGIRENALRTLVELNIERNKVENVMAFAPDYINVLEVNLELVKQYPEVYSKFFKNNELQKIRGEQS